MRVEEDEGNQHQQQPYQLTSHYREWFIVAQQQLEPWLADCWVLYWHHFEEEEKVFILGGI
jgi:hypothetical protein